MAEIGNNISEEQIKKLIEQHKARSERDRLRYQSHKDDEDFIKGNRQRAKDHYENNRDKRLEHYKENKTLMNARSSYYYYKKKDKIDLFKERCPDKLQVLLSNNYLI